VALVHKASDEKRIVFFFKSFRTKEIKEVLLTIKKLANNFAFQAKSDLRKFVASYPRVGRRWYLLNDEEEISIHLVFIYHHRHQLYGIGH
jgi:hypothetical protein